MDNIFWQKSLVPKTPKMIINNKDGGYIYSKTKNFRNLLTID